LRNGAPFAELPLPLAQLRTALQHRERQQGIGYAAVPAHGLETVLRAVKQLLGSGVTSIEQVTNMLSRLNDLPPPALVETHLKLIEEPMADTARYDNLHDQGCPMSDIMSQFNALKLHGSMLCKNPSSAARRCG